ncbi:hypothetical protein RvY_16266 [Ramazzottius varieornatus]|uniref:Sulfatase N-terminal domain-containing protein n=1 Tax=Ramazzottius varieornatus TaxID=947166 RepID=A0A1D1VXU8_RAMVA|nr:hypothetical protein RvY_16266 [Ramazzottius varieornatus]
MTGKYPIRHGLQYKVIKNGEPRGLSVTEKIFPQYLKELGYSTHLIGKWNLGYYQRRMLPTCRGFDTFFGYHGTSIDYYNYTFLPKDRSYAGFDLWNGTQPAYEYVGKYATTAFTEAAVRLIEDQIPTTPMFLYLSHIAPHVASGPDEFPVPQEYIDRFPHIAHPGRRKYAGMVAALDDSVGAVVQALERKGILNNTVIVFFSDNGGGAAEQLMFPLNKPSFGSNWPLRGAKNTQFEGGVRVAAVVWSSLLRKAGRVSTELYHITDLLPTVTNLAGGAVDSSAGLDGFDVWQSISEDSPSPRKELLIQTDVTNNEYAFRWKGYKLLKGLYVDKEGRSADDWYEPPGGLNTSLIVSTPGAIRCESSEIPCDPNLAPCLFDVVVDPCERNNIAADNPDVVELMMEKLLAYNSTALPSMFLPNDPRAHPGLHGGLMASWEE